MPEWDLVYRDPATHRLVHNFTRMEETLDPFIAAGIRPLPRCWTMPGAFVSEPNRFFGAFGLGSAPDNKSGLGRSLRR